MHFFPLWCSVCKRGVWETTTTTTKLQIIDKSGDEKIISTSLGCDLGTASRNFWPQRKPARWIFHSLSILEKHSCQSGEGTFCPFQAIWPSRDNRIIIKLSIANFCFEVSSLHNSLRGVLNTVYVEPRLIKCIQHHISVVVRINFFSFSDWVKYYMQKFDTNCTLEYNAVYDFKRRRDPNFSRFDRLS